MIHLALWSCGGFGEEHLQRIEALSPGESVLLGEASISGDLNSVAKQFGLHRSGPRARDYSLKMVWVDELQQALFLGANHGSPHRLNDVWAFDLAALEWILLYGPDNPRSYMGLGDDVSDVRFHGGVLQTERGGPAVIAHTWWGITYDPKRRKLLFMNTWVTDMDRAVKAVGGDPVQRFKGPPLWEFDPFKRAWLPLLTERPWPRAPFGGLLEYAEVLGGALWHANNWQMQASWLLDEDMQWQQLIDGRNNSEFRRHAPPPEQVGYVDSQRAILVAQHDDQTYHLDLNKRRWERQSVHSSSEGELPKGHDARSVFYHDPRSGLGILFELRGSRIWLYDPALRRWHRQVPSGDPAPTGRKRLAYFDPRRNVLVVIADRKVWAYRPDPLVSSVQ